MQVFEHVIREEGQKFLGWRTVPVKSEILGKTSGRYEPVIKQVFIGKSADITDPMEFERKLYVIRKRVAAWIRNNEVPNKFTRRPRQQVQHLPRRGLPLRHRPLRPHDGLQGHAHALPARRVFPGSSRPGFRIGAGADAHPLLDQHLPELVARPSEPLHRPQRRNQHGHGQRQLHEGPPGALPVATSSATEIESIFPVINEDGSDSARFDNALEFMHFGGYDLVHAMMMMIPEPWERHTMMDEDKKAFYEFHACMMEPWDGPASITFSDGQQIGAVLDRNGLRPSRYYVTDDDLVIMASEVGVMPDLDPLTIVEKGRLRPGRMFLVDMKEGRIVPDEEVKKRVYSAKPYQTVAG